METSPSIKELAAALATAQGELKSINKTGKGNYGKYAELAPTLEHVLPVLSKQGLSVVQMPILMDDGTTGLTTQLMHKSGEWIKSTYPVRMQQQTPQAQGSAITYARRYALMALVGTAGDDDDGQAGTDGANPEARKPATTKAATTTVTPIGVKRVNTVKLELLLREAKRASGLTDKAAVIEYFKTETGKHLTEVTDAEFDVVMSHLKSLSDQGDDGVQST